VRASVVPSTLQIVRVFRLFSDIEPTALLAPVSRLYAIVGESADFAVLRIVLTATSVQTGPYWPAEHKAQKLKIAACAGCAHKRARVFVGP
jgi:hypothetical protein